MGVAHEDPEVPVLRALIPSVHHFAAVTPALVHPGPWARRDEQANSPKMRLIRIRPDSGRPRPQ